MIPQKMNWIGVYIIWILWIPHACNVLHNLLVIIIWEICTFENTVKPCNTVQSIQIEYNFHNTNYGYKKYA